MNYNLELTLLYEKYKMKWKEDVEKGIISKDLLSQLSCPLLLHVDNGQWDNSKKRILLVGQENLGWDDGKDFKTFAAFLSHPDSVLRMKGVYEGFNFGATYTRSPFWKAYNQIRLVAEQNQSYSVLWTNLYRCCFNGGSVLKANMHQQQEMLQISREIFLDELKLLKPKAVIFTTGPYYDETIEQILQGEKIVDFSPEFNNQRSLAKIEHRDLPSGKSIRTYHPNYLQRSKKWELIDMAIDEVCH